MPFCRTLLALAVCASAVTATELKTLKGQSIVGDVVSVSSTEVVIAKADQKIKTPIEQVLTLDLAAPTKLPADAKFIDVELVDGSQLRCLNFVIKGKEVELTILLTNQNIKLPLASVAHVLTNAQEEKWRKDWKERLKTNAVDKERLDVFFVLRETPNGPIPNPLKGTIGEGDEEGKTLAFTLKPKTGDPERKIDADQQKIHGLIFQRTPDPLAPPVQFKLIDGYGNLVMVSNVSTTATGLTATTPTGAKLDYTFQQLSKLDYSKGKLTYLSDMKPLREDQTYLGEKRTNPIPVRLFMIGRDHNLEENKGTIVLDKVPYRKGLALQAYTELEFDLDGEYREFSAVAGIDAKVRWPGKAVLRIEGDGKELLKLEFAPRTMPEVLPVTLNIKDVRKLRITVSSNDWNDIAKQIYLGNAKVSK
jgi:NPCBM/NEW2 domain